MLLMHANRDDLKALRCRFGCDEVVGIFSVPDGCICWADPLQALCSQHAIKAQSGGPIICVIDFRKFIDTDAPMAS